MPKTKRLRRYTHLHIESIHYPLNTLKDRKHVPPMSHAYSILIKKSYYLLSDKITVSHLLKTISRRLLEDLFIKNNN